MAITHPSNPHDTTEHSPPSSPYHRNTSPIQEEINMDSLSQSFSGLDHESGHDDDGKHFILIFNNCVVIV